MLVLLCNSIEVLRLRNHLIFINEQKIILSEVYQEQANLMGRGDIKALHDDEIEF